MKRLLTALAVILPLAATAQYEPVPAGSGPGAADAGSRRNTWYIGFGLGTGNGSVSYGGSTYSFQDEHDFAWGMSTSPTNLSFNFKVGATLSPNLLLGFDITAVRSQYDNSGSSTAIQVNNYDAVVTWFPQGEGFFARGGAGVSAITYSVDTPIGSGSNSASGFNVLGGVGYAFWIGQNFNLTLNADYSFQNYGSSDLGIDNSNFWNLWVGFDWY